MINIDDFSNKIKDYFSPKIVGEVNDVFVKIAKIKGDKVPWHNHQDEDELFYILKGGLIFETEGESDFIMNEGDMHVVKRGIEHRVHSKEECTIMLIENKTTQHTGDVISEITRSIEEQKE